MFDQVLMLYTDFMNRNLWFWTPLNLNCTHSNHGIRTIAPRGKLLPFPSHGQCWGFGQGQGQFQGWGQPDNCPGVKLTPGQRQSLCQFYFSDWGAIVLEPLTIVIRTLIEFLAFSRLYSFQLFIQLSTLLFTLQISIFFYSFEDKNILLKSKDQINVYNRINGATKL